MKNETRPTRHGQAARSSRRAIEFTYDPKAMRAEPGDPEARAASDAAVKFEQAVIDSCKSEALKARATADGVDLYRIVVTIDIDARRSNRELEKGFLRLVTQYAEGGEGDVRQGHHQIIIIKYEHLSIFKTSSSENSASSKLTNAQFLIDALEVAPRAQQEPEQGAGRDENDLGSLRPPVERPRALSPEERRAVIEEEAKTNPDQLLRLAYELAPPDAQNRFLKDQLATLQTTNQAANELGLTPDGVKKVAQKGNLGTMLGRDYQFTYQELAAYKEKDRKPGPRPKDVASS